MNVVAESPAQNHYGITPLASACLSDNADVVGEMLQAGADPDEKLPGNETALMWACRRGNVSIVEQLLQHDADPNRSANSSQTPLMWAAAGGHLDVIKRLNSAGVDLTPTLDSGFDATMFAVREGHLDIVRYLVDQGVDVNREMKPKRNQARGPRKGMSALLLAVENAHYELALELVAMGADPNDQRSGFTALHAISWGRKTGRGDNPGGDPPPRGSGTLTSLQFVRALARAGADVDVVLTHGKGGRATLSPRGATPFLYAARTADLDLMNCLLELGADPMIPNIDQTTSLMAAAGVGVKAVDEEAGTETEVLAAVQRLLELGADPNAVDKHGETAMHGAAYRNYPKVVDSLFAAGAKASSWDHPNDWGWTPIRIAQGYRPGSFKPNPPTINALVAAGGSVALAEKHAKKQKRYP